MCSLLFNIVPYRTFISMVANHIGKITICPEFSIPQLLLHMWVKAKYFSHRDTFYQRYRYCYAICRSRLCQKMNIILACSDPHKIHLVTSPKLKKRLVTLYLRLHQIQRDEISLEGPDDKVISLNYGSCGYSLTRIFCAPWDGK